MFQGLVRTRYIQCNECLRAAAFDTVRQRCTVISCALYDVLRDSGPPPPPRRPIKYPDNIGFFRRLFSRELYK